MVSSNMDWSCSQCTFINPRENQICEMCQSQHTMFEKKSYNSYSPKKALVEQVRTDIRRFHLKQTHDCCPLLIRNYSVDELAKLFKNTKFYSDTRAYCQRMTIAEYKNLQHTLNVIKSLGIPNRASQAQLVLQTYPLLDQTLVVCLRLQNASEPYIPLSKQEIKNFDKILKANGSFINNMLLQVALDIILDYYDVGFVNIPVDVFLYDDQQSRKNFIVAVNPWRLREIEHIDKNQKRDFPPPTKQEIADKLGLYNTSM